MTNKLLYLLLFFLQFLCGGFLVYDIFVTFFGIQTRPINWQVYEFFEIGATLSIVLGVFVTGSLLRRSLSRQRKAEETLRLASGAFMQVIEERFAEWSLTPAERDVALFSLKGLSTAEIAALRQTSEGTVKAQTNAIYRKAGVSGRSHLMSLFIDDLMGDALPGTQPSGTASPAPAQGAVA